jgi:branched-chain amino acid transport system permease protein
MLIVDVFIYGSVFGSVLALLASGYSLVYGVGGIINLVHGGFYILTAYMIFWFMNSNILPYPLAIIICLLLITIFGAITYLALIKPGQKRGEISVLIITFALGFLIERAILLYEGFKVGEILPIKLDPFIPGSVEIFDYFIDIQDLIIIISAVIILSLLIISIRKTKLGKSIRAVSQDKEAAELMGINVKKILMITIAISALLAGVAAALYAPKTNLVPYLGWEYLVLAMSVVILGGMGSITGSLIAAYLIGYVRFFTQLFIDLPFQTGFATLIHLVLIIVILIIRPRGLLGKKEEIY